MYSDSGEHYKHYDRWYRVSRRFKDENTANEYMKEHPDEGVLTVTDGGTIIIANCKDKGIQHKSLDFHYLRTDSGFCRAYFKRLDNNKLFCIQKGGAYSNTYFELMPCTKDGEPEYSLPVELIRTISKPTSGDSIDTEIIEYLIKKGVLE